MEGSAKDGNLHDGKSDAENEKAKSSTRSTVAKTDFGRNFSSIYVVIPRSARGGEGGGPLYHTKKGRRPAARYRHFS